MSEYSNPYKLELILARLFGWAWFFFMIVFIGMWITGNLPPSWAAHKDGLIILIVVAAVFIGGAEKRAATDSAKFELKMHGVTADEVKK
jgi:membrane associated rhomboid family serine protease